MLYDKQATTEAEQLRSRNMAEVADTSDTALPSTARVETHLTETEKHHQLGGSVMEQILEATVEGFRPRGAETVARALFPSLLVDCANNIRNASGWWMVRII